jgi:hypothetical protein
VFYDSGNANYFDGGSATDFTLFGNIESIAPAPAPAAVPAMPGTFVALAAALLGALGAKLVGRNHRLPC